MNGIKLFDGYIITADSAQFIFGKPVTRITKKDDKVTESEVMTDAKYFPTLGSALHGAYKHFQRELVQEDTMSLKEAIQACTDLEQRLMRVAEPEQLASISPALSRAQYDALVDKHEEM